MIILYNQKYIRWFSAGFSYGITIRPFILMADKKLFAIGPKLHHEMIHYRQQEDLGLVRFFIIYVRDLFMNYWSGMTWREAYWNIPFEVDARKGERNAA